MKGLCRKCGQPLKKGNIVVIRKPGKRPVRECRRCPAVVTTTPSVAAMPKKTADAVLELASAAKRQLEGTTGGNGLQRPQDTTGGPVTWKGDFDVDPPPRFRYFMTRDQAEKVKASVERNVAFGFGIAFEAIPVLEHLVDQDPDAYANLVEVTIDWKAE